MEKRQIIQIPSEQVKKLKELEKIRKDLEGYPISKKIHILLQEKLREEFRQTVKKPSKEDWVEYIRELLPIHIIAPIAIGIINFSKEMIGERFTKILVASEGDKSWWCNHNEDINNVGKYLLSNFNDKKFAKKYHEDYEKVINDMIVECLKLRKKDLSKLSGQGLLKKYISFDEKFMRFHALAFDIDAIDIYLEESMKEKFKKILSKKGKQKEFSSKYSILTNPTELSYVNEEELELYRIVKEIKENEKLLQLFNDDVERIISDLRKKYKSLAKKIDYLVQKYWWTSLGWKVRTEKDFKTYVLDIKKIVKSNRNIDQEIHRLKHFAENSKKAKESLAKEFSFDDELRFYLEVFEKYVAYHDYRKEIQMKGTYVMNKFLFEISKRMGVNYEDLVWAWPSEIENYLKTGTIDFSNIRKRKEAYFILVTKNGIEELTGEEAIKRRKEELMADIEEIYDFKGISVSLGKVTGKAKVCFSASDAIKKVEKGDILVASMTLPDYVPAMKKAAAIVTDEGGITCHAAIVSRELKIPCVVGTRIATRALKDNMMIEVNANHGRIKILKNNK